MVMRDDPKHDLLTKVALCVRSTLQALRQVAAISSARQSALEALCIDVEESLELLKREFVLASEANGVFDQRPAFGDAKRQLPVHESELRRLLSGLPCAAPQTP
jgi:hypothetical protein